MPRIPYPTETTPTYCLQSKNDYYGRLIEPFFDIIIKEAPNEYRSQHCLFLSTTTMASILFFSYEAMKLLATLPIVQSVEHLSLLLLNSGMCASLFVGDKCQP